MSGLRARWETLPCVCACVCVCDEFNFVIECSCYSDIRKKFYRQNLTSVKSMFVLCHLFSASKNIQLKFAIRFGKVTL